MTFVHLVTLKIRRFRVSRRPLDVKDIILVEFGDDSRKIIQIAIFAILGT